MKTRLEQVLERCLRGREVVIWGSPTRLLSRALEAYRRLTATVDFTGDFAADPRKHYVVAVSDDDLEDFLLDARSKHFIYVDDYLTFNDPGGELPFEWECYGVKIGRQTYFSDDVAGACGEGYVKSIGHFTSINGSVDIAVNHQLDMTFVSDDLADFFNAENAARFKDRLLANPGRPYALGKEPITIGSDVYIGANAFINASKVTNIGDGAIIGSGAVVLENVPPYAVVVGVPAKIKRYRFAPETIQTLLRVKWWNWTIEEINTNAEALFSPELFMHKFG